MDYKLTLKEEEINAILYCLSEKPYVQVVDLINNIHNQCANNK